MKRILCISLFYIMVSSFILTSCLYAETPASKTTVKKCPTCNKLYSQETKFCGDDGTKLVEVPVKMVCPDCKKEGAQGENFCKEHGKKLVPLSDATPTLEEDVIRQKKELAKKYYKEGNDYCDAGSYDLAIESYKKAEEAFSDFPPLHYNLGWLYSKLGNPEQAI